MRSTKETILRKGIGFVLAAVATLALAVALPVHAQDQQKPQGQTKSKSQSGDAEKAKEKAKTKDSGDSFGYGKSYGDGYGQTLDQLTDKLSESYALLGQAKALTLNYDSSELANLATELKLESKLNFDVDTKLNFQYAMDFDGLGGKLLGQQDGKDREREMARARGDRESSLYSAGSQAIDQAKWQVAEDRFDQVIEIKGKRADAAMFWKAWAQNKLGKRTEALATLNAMEKEYPQSHWLDDAKKLEVEVKQLSGRPVSPETEGDCELKLLALNGLQQADPAKAVPLLEKMMHSTDCVKLRSQALFVLAQSNSPEALGDAHDTNSAPAMAINRS